jgi:hypothetical protein
MSFFVGIPPIVADRCIALFLESKSFAEANDWASEIRMYASAFSAEQQRKILVGIHYNGQVQNANAIDSVISAFRKSNVIAPAEFESILENNGLEVFMLDPDEPAF